MTDAELDALKTQGIRLHTERARRQWEALSPEKQAAVIAIVKAHRERREANRDGKAALDALDDAEVNGTVSWEQVKAELRLTAEKREAFEASWERNEEAYRYLGTPDGPKDDQSPPAD